MLEPTILLGLVCLELRFVDVVLVFLGIAIMILFIR